MKRYVKLVLSLILAVSLSVVVYRMYDDWRGIQASEEAMEAAGLGEAEPSQPPEPSEPAKEPPGGEAEPLPAEAAHLAEVDLASLQAINEDVVGWLEIPGTELSYPVVQGRDNEYYLSHNWKKERSGGGSVFLEQTNRRDLSGFHLIAYAHRMRNDTMFGTLKYYKDPEFCREHPSIYLVTGDGVRRYDIFSAHRAGVTGLVYRLDLEESGLEAEFIRECAANSEIETGVEPEPDAQVLTLSTCTGQGYDTRWVVQGTLRCEYEPAKEPAENGTEP